jgi:hypothetical protein
MFATITMNFREEVAMSWNSMSQIPRLWLLHKKWLSKRDMRDPEKKQRDLGQAQILWDLVPAKLPQYPIDPDFLNSVPAPLKEAGNELAGIQPEAAVRSENWTPRPPSF